MVIFNLNICTMQRQCECRPQKLSKKHTDENVDISKEMLKIKPDF